MSTLNKEIAKDSESILSGTTLCPPTQNRTLHIYYESWKSRTVHVMDSDKQTALYDVDYRMRKPQITVRNPGSETAIGTTTVHSWTGAVDIESNGHTFSLMMKGWKAYEMLYKSSVFSNQMMNWKRNKRWSVFEAVLVDENEVPKAKLSTPWAMKKMASIELMDGDLSQEAMNEVVTTGLTVLYVALMYAV